jgi:hypothetical protein
MSRSGYLLAILASSVLASACTDDQEPNNAPPPGSTSGDESTTFDHDNNTISPWDLLERLQAEGPPSFTSHVHSCAKVRYATLGTVLKQLGVDMTNTTALSAADLYNNGFNALGGANYANRIRENISISTSGASREFDIFAAAADEIITAMPSIARCQVGGVGAQLFDATTNACRADGIQCLLGVPPQQGHLDICNVSVTQASDVATGKRIAVATLLAAAYTCE